MKDKLIKLARDNQNGVVAFAFVMMVLFFRYGNSTLGWLWPYRWGVISAMMAILVGLRLFANRLVPVSMFVFLVAQGSYYYVTKPWGHLSSSLQQALRWRAADNTAAVVLIAMFLALMPYGFFYRHIRNALFLAWYFCCLGCAFMTQIPLEHPLLHNPSITGTFIAIVAAGMPMHPLLLLLTGVCLLSLKATTPFAVLGAGLLARAILVPSKPGTPRYAAKKWILFCVVPLAAICVVYFGYSKFMGNGTGRFTAWEILFEWFNYQSWQVYLFGAGNGSVSLILPILQAEMGYPPNSAVFFFYAHNDWLQILVEFGLVGSFLTVLVLKDMYSKFSKFADSGFLGMFVAFGVGMISNFPLHHPLTAVVAIMLVATAYFEECENAD